MARVLVTGGAGFIGSHVAQALVGRGHKVTVLDDLSGGYLDSVPPEARFVQGTITDAPLIASLSGRARLHEACARPSLQFGHWNSSAP